MALRSGVFIVPTDRWYIERTVWLVAGIVLLTSTALALWAHPSGCFSSSPRARRRSRLR
jgi:hypothetical protein